VLGSVDAVLVRRTRSAAEHRPGVLGAGRRHERLVGQLAAERLDVDGVSSIARAPLELLQYGIGIVEGFIGVVVVDAQLLRAEQLLDDADLLGCHRQNDLAAVVLGRCGAVTDRVNPVSNDGVSYRSTAERGYR